jgi:hypothetical protein
MTLKLVPSVTHRTIRIHNPHTLILIKDGRTIDEMTPEAAIAWAQAVIGQAKKAQEMQEKNAEKLAFDGAVLLRAGFPVGLTNNPKILDMTRKEAESNRELRRHMPGGIKSTSQVGAPAVRHEPKRD